jgi:hypothetical protein
MFGVTMTANLQKLCHRPAQGSGFYDLEREFPPIWRKPDKRLCKQPHSARYEIAIGIVPFSGRESFSQTFVQAFHGSSFR